jgi:hypothetical protein
VIMGRAPKTLECDAVAFATNPMAIVAPPTTRSHGASTWPSVLGDCGFVVREQGSGTRAAMQRLFARTRWRSRW